MRLSAHGMTVDAPPGWEVRISRRAEDDRPANPVLHAATFPLPADPGDFGSGAVVGMGAEDVLVTLFEYDPPAATTALFAPSGRPAVGPGDFSPRALQRTLPGQSGRQWFFHEGDRAFCLYIVLGSHSRRVALAGRAAGLVDTLDLGGTP